MQHLIRLLAQVGTLLVLALQPVRAAPGDPFPAGPMQASAIHYAFAIYYPGEPSKVPLSVLATRLRKLPNGPTLVDKLEKLPQRATVRGIWVTDAQQSYAPPGLESLRYFGRGLTLDQAKALQGANKVLVLAFAHPATESLKAYRNSLHLTEQVALATDGLLWDDETREAFTAEAWHSQRLETWDGELPDVLKHTVTAGLAAAWN